MPKVIRNVNDPQNAVTVDGIPVHREDRIYLSSYKQWFPVLNTSMHFCYKDPINRNGRSSVLCTCGSPGATFGYEAYKRWNSFVGSEVIMCIELAQRGHHSDGSHE